MNDADVAPYRGLVISTASMVVGQLPDLDFDDVVQILWIKVMYGLERYDPSRTTIGRDRFIFGCIHSQVIDLKRRAAHRAPRRPLGFDDLGFESQDKMEAELGLSVGSDEVFQEAEDEFQLPNTLTLDERAVIELLQTGYAQAEAARFLGWAPGRMKATMREIRTKLADWRPDAPAKQPALRAAA